MLDSYIKGFKSFLQLEKSLSDNSVQAYIRDVQKMHFFFMEQFGTIKLNQIQLKHLRLFLKWLNSFYLSHASQARIISGIKSFFKYLVLEDVLVASPAELLEAPKTQRKLPDFLTFEEIELIVNAIDLSTDAGTRNKAIFEVMYSCGLRVSEVVNLKITQLHFADDFIRVTGKGNKERLVPIGSDAKKYIAIYKDTIRCHQNIKPGKEDILFLNAKGSSLSRVAIFYFIKAATEQAGIKKNVHPHTFRHSFATHLLEGGADLRAIQEMLGHQSITTTEIYTHLDKAFLKDTLMRFHPGFK
jgi:integrase/recombinase XerD